MQLVDYQRHQFLSDQLELGVQLTEMNFGNDVQPVKIYIYIYIYIITLRKMPHSSSRKESTLMRQVPPKSIDFLLASCDPLFPYTKGNAQRGLWVICRKVNFYFRANSLFYSSTNI